MTRSIEIYDTTLRDGAQGEGVNFSVSDKCRIAEHLDGFGVDFIEGGWPGSNPRDEAFFQAIKQRPLKRIKVAAFGSTRRAGARASEDRNLEKLLRAETPVVTIFGKSWDMHVRDDLRIPLKENFELIHDTVRYLKRHVDEVVYDAEHFFDGYRANPEFALECMQVAADAGADVLCLCDTNGGRMPWEIAAAIDAVRAQVATPIGIHCHNDSELAVANSLIAVEHGAIQVQGTINGIGERCGNVNLCSVIANLQLKMGHHVVSAANLRRLRELSRFVDELANIEHSKRQAYVGQSAFAHKGGVHVAAVQRNPKTYEHIDPALVGNAQRVLVSDLSGRANILYKARQFGVDLEQLDGHVRRLVAEVKELEHKGFQFEGAEASLELRMHRVQHGPLRYFELIQFRAVDEKGYMRLDFGPSGACDVKSDARIEHDPASSWATVMLSGPNGEIEHTAAQGDGPVHALDTALRRALRRFYPNIEAVRLLDYKVRVLGGGEGSAAPVRVLIESGDGTDRWGTVGVSLNVIDASWQALVDSFEYKIYKDAKQVKTKPAARPKRPSHRRAAR